ncbi:MAG TPA: hypothetical protein VKD69_24345, partial [Vicinamibacterales bacterium]|nr:hypothetical protein [Vicinamibacterales bacterium]
MPAHRSLRALVLASLVIAPLVALHETAGVAAQVPSASDPPKYVLPPRNVVEAFDAELLPQTLVSPNRQVLALTRGRAYPTIAELSQPMLRLAGVRVNAKTNGPFRASGLTGTGIYAITLKKIDGGAETAVTMPPQARVSNVKFSPDGSRIAFLQTKDTGIELWIADGATGSAKAIVAGSDRINAAAGDPCDWLKDNVTIVCELVPAGRGAPPAEPTVPAGPNVHENYGKAAPAPTYEDLLKTAHDDALFDYYFTGQLTAINTSSGAKTAIGRPTVLRSVSPSPDGQHLLVTKAKKPYSHLVPLNGFAHEIEVWARSGDVEKKIADQPSREGIPLTGVETG